MPDGWLTFVNTNTVDFVATAFRTHATHFFVLRRVFFLLGLYETSFLVLGSLLV